MIGIVAAALFFGCAAFLGATLSKAVCAHIEPFEDGPPAGEPPVPVLIVAAALIGASLMLQNAQVEQLAVAALAVVALVACWCSDTLCGIVPDVFTLIPLLLLLLLGVWERDWWTFASAAILFVPFAVAAASSNGRGMGWGDVKLVALGGALLGAPLALLAMAAACIAAAIGYRVKRIERGPIAFAPYIVASIGIVLPLGFIR